MKKKMLFVTTFLLIIAFFASTLNMAMAASVEPTSLVNSQGEAKVMIIDGQIRDDATLWVNLHYLHRGAYQQFVEMKLSDNTRFIWQIEDIKCHETAWGKITTIKAIPIPCPYHDITKPDDLGPITVIIQEGKDVLIANGPLLNYYGTITPPT